MSIVDDVTVLILTYNEAPNIGRTLEAVAWAQRILIIDSGSTDETLDIVRQYPQAEVVSRTLVSYFLTHPREGVDAETVKALFGTESMPVFRAIAAHLAAVRSTHPIAVEGVGHVIYYDPDAAAAHLRTQAGDT